MKLGDSTAGQVVGVRLKAPVMAATLLAISALAACSSNNNSSGPDVVPPPPPGQAAFGYAVRGGTELVKFDAEDPSVVTVIGDVIGLPSGETIVGLDFRPPNPNLEDPNDTPGLGDLHAVTNTGSMLIVDPATGMGTPIQAIQTVDAMGAETNLFVAGRYGVDFNPTANALRVVGDNGLNLRVPPSALVNPAPAPPATVNTLVDGRMGYLRGVTAAAYTNPNPPAMGGTTALFVIDAENNQLYQQDANNGPLTAIGDGLAVDATAANGYDIVQVGDANEHYAVLTVGDSSGFYTIDVVTGVATFKQALPSSTYVGMVAFAEDSANERIVIAMSEDADGNYTAEFYAYDVEAGTLTADQELPVDGLPEGETIVGFDIRTTSLEDGLDVGYAVGRSNAIYTLLDAGPVDAPTSLMAEEVAELSTPLAGDSFGVDFNPRADLLRIVSNTGQNLRVNLQANRQIPVGEGNERAAGFAFVDGTTRLVAPAPQIVATAYRAAPSTTGGGFQFAIDARDSSLYRVAVPNDGALVRVGSLGVTLPVNGEGAAAQSFDIISSGDIEGGVLALRAVGETVSTLFTVNLETGATTEVGAIGDDGAVTALTVRFEDVPEPSPSPTAPPAGGVSAVEVR